MRAFAAYTLLILPALLFGQAKKHLLRDARTAYSAGDYQHAYSCCRKLLLADSLQPQAGIIAVASGMKLHYPPDSLVTARSSVFASREPDAPYYRAVLLHAAGEFGKAVSQLDSLGKVPPRKRTVSDSAATLLRAYCINGKRLKDNAKMALVKNMGPAINSEYPDYVPVVLPDESMMFFTSKRPNSLHPKKNGDNSYYEDVYVSLHTDKGWRPAENLGFPINTETNDACVAISPDGQRMIVYRTAADQLSGDLYITRLEKNNRWGPLRNMGEAINSPYVETSACFSMDTSEIYFSSDRPGGYGGKDLYRIRRMADGRWARPFNLGPKVNTPEDEDAPFLHPDGKTLYFSSRCSASMGGFDVFKSVWEDSAFTAPENLGYPINDVGDDIFFVLSPSGKTGYYSSAKSSSRGGTDIYEIDTRFGDNDLIVRTGTVYLGPIPGRARVTLTDDTGEVCGIYNSNPDSGRFILVVHPLRSYTATVEADGFSESRMNLAPAVGNNTPLLIKLVPDAR